MLAVPSTSSLTAMSTDIRPDAQAASRVTLVPPRSKRLATRPAEILVNTPANASSVHSGRRSQASLSGSIRFRCARAISESPSRPPPSAEPTITDVFSRSNSPPSYPASISARRATSRDNNWGTPICGITFGGMPYRLGSNAISGKKPPHFESAESFPDSFSS